MYELETFKRLCEDESYKDGELIELAKDMIKNLEDRLDEAKNVAYNAICLGQLDEIHGDSLADELGCSRDYLVDIAEGDEAMIENITGEVDDQI